MAFDHTKTACAKAKFCLGTTICQQGKDRHSCAKFYHSRLEDATPTEGVGSKLPVSSLSTPFVHACAEDFVIVPSAKDWQKSKE